MPRYTPIYMDQGATYHADTCGPLVKAVEQGQMRLEALARGSYPGRRLGRSHLHGVRTVGYWNASEEQDWGLDWHRNEGVELTFLEAGQLGFGADEHGYPLRAGDMTITRPWQPHRVGDPHLDACRLYWVILDVGVRRPNQAWKWPAWLVLTAEDLKELTNMLQHNEQPVWHAPAEIQRCFQQIGSAVRENVANNKISLVTVYLNELFLLLLEMLRKRGISLNPSLSGSRRTVELFLNDLKSNPESLAHPWTVPLMAEQCGLGTTAFVDHCKHLTNMTPVQYLNHFRVNAASALLIENPDMSVTDVAFACGFASSQYFATVFRRFAGASPKVHRQEAGS